jgi:predicted Zn-dependent peptidase
MVDENPAIDRASLAVGAPLPPFGEKEHWAAWIVREMLAGPDGRLCSDRTLLSKSGLIVPSTLAWRQWPISPLPIQFGSRPYLAVVALCHPARVEVTRQGILRHIAEIAEGEFTEADLERARVRVANTWARELAAPRDRARMLALAAMLGIELPSVDQVWKVVNEISEAEVKEAAYSVLRRVSVGLQMPST